MPAHEGMSHRETRKKSRPFCYSIFVMISSFDIRISSFLDVSMLEVI